MKKFEDYIYKIGRYNTVFKFENGYFVSVAELEKCYGQSYAGIFHTMVMTMVDNGDLQRCYLDIEDVTEDLELEEKETFDLINKIKNLPSSNSSKLFFNELEALQSEQEEKFTLLSFCEFGLPYVIQFRLVKAEVDSYAQYDEAFFITARKKRARNPILLRFLPHEEFVIWKGWINPNLRIYDIKSETSFVQVRRGRYSSFDNRYLLDCLEATQEAPIIRKGV